MRIVWGWVGAVVVVAATVVGGVAIANATVFSASSFARDYLTALSADRIDEVLALPGVIEAGTDTSLLTDRVGERFAFEILGDDEVSGAHRVRVAFGTDPDDLDARTVLAIEQVGTRFLLFPRWGFAQSPLAELTVELSGDPRFTVGLRAARSETADAVVTLFRPGVYRLGHESEFLESRVVDVAAERDREQASLAITPNGRFVDAVNEALDSQLDACAAQTVLFPLGCPFGASVTDRVVSDPVWELSDVPTVSIEPGDALGLWRVVRFSASARVSVEVQDLFDGAIDSEELDVRFDAAYDIRFDGDEVVLLPR